MTGPRAQAVEILLQRIDPSLPVPAYAHPGDAGADLVSAIDIDLGPGERLLVPTGIAIALPAGYAAFVHPRSGLAARFGLSIVNAPGTIDAGFRGEIKVLVINHDPVQRVQLQRGHRIAQLVVQRVEHVRFLEVASLPGSMRGEGGYGSTGGFLERGPLDAPAPKAAEPEPAAPPELAPTSARRRTTGTGRAARHTATPQAPADTAALADTPIRRAGRRELGARKSPVADGPVDREPVLEPAERAEPPPAEPAVERAPAEPVLAAPVPPERSEDIPGEANMSMFRRGNVSRKGAPKRTGEDPSSSSRGRSATAVGGAGGSGTAQPPDAREPSEGRPTRAAGPWDITEIPDPAEDGRVDLGGLWLPAFDGLEIRVEADPETGSIVSVTLVLDDSALQVQPFAAPRTGGIWTEVRTEMAAGLTQQGGTADMVEGPFGTELRARVPVTRTDGTSGVEAARFIGVDGPRWFLRGALTGRAAAQPADHEPLLDVFREIVVVRGSTPMAPREPIPLMLPQAVQEADPAAEETLEPFERGPEITEIR